MLRLALLSFWHVHAKDYERDANEHPGTEIVAAWDEQPERGRREAEKRGWRFYERLDELLANPEIDGVDDAHCIRLLRTIARAMPAHGRLLVIQQVLPDGTATWGLFDGAMPDLNMLVMLPGRERTAAEYHQLLNVAGLTVTVMHETRALMTIIEAMKDSQSETMP